MALWDAFNLVGMQRRGFTWCWLWSWLVSPLLLLLVFMFRMGAVIFSTQQLTSALNQTRSQSEVRRFRFGMYGGLCLLGDNVMITKYIKIDGKCPSIHAMLLYMYCNKPCVSSRNIIAIPGLTVAMI